MRIVQRMAFRATVSAAALLVCAAGVALADESRFEKGQVSLQLGVFEPRGESDLWDFNDEFTTQDITDFDGAIGGIAFGAPLGRHVDMVFGLSYYQARTEVAYKNVTTVDGDPIRQHHRLREAPLEISFRYLPLARETRRGRLNPVIPYLGGGGGGMVWEYVEKGDFVDDPENPTFLFFDKRKSRSVTGTAHALAGIEIQFPRNVSIFFEARYRWAKDDLDNDFDDDLDRFDLGGASLSVGGTFRFGDHGRRSHHYSEERDDHDDRDRDRGDDRGDDEEDDD